MTSPTIRLLHVEDDRIQRAVIARHLSKMEDFQFATQFATTEDEAVTVFLRDDFDLVILDYSSERRERIELPAAAAARRCDGAGRRGFRRGDRGDRLAID